MKDTSSFPSVVESLNPTSRKLYIFFGGLGQGVGIPPFEFFRSSGALTENKIFIRDLSQCWYQNGVRGIGRTIYDLRDHISSRIKDICPDEVLFIGNSMGAYAAILIGCMIGDGEIHAFSPQTFISAGKRSHHRDQRWRRQIIWTYVKVLFRPHIYDLVGYMPEQREKPVNIYVSEKDALDCVHADNISNFPYVVIHKYPDGGHGLVADLRDSGKLADIFRS